MVKVCCVTGCKNIWNPNRDVSFFGFPLKNENLLGKWKQVVPTKYAITKYTAICSDHFSNASYTYKSGKRFLNKDAVPTAIQGALEDNVAGTSLDSETCVGKCQREDDTPLRDITSITEENLDCPITEQGRSSSIEPTRTCRETLYVDCETPTTPVKLQKHVGTQISPHRLAASETEEQLRKKIRLLTSRLHRREKKISMMTELLSDLRKNGKLTDALEEVFLNRFSGMNVELFRNEIDNAKNSKFRSQYSKKVKEFASTLYFCSPKAYAYIRTALHLPHEGTLRKWEGVELSDVSRAARDQSGSPRPERVG